MGEGKGPSGRVPFSKAVKRSLAFVGLMFVITGTVELYMLANPNEVAPISWSFWWLGENAPWLPVILAGVSGASMSHFGWYVRPGSFWAPVRLRSALIIGASTLTSIAIVQAWALFALAAAFLGGVVAAHRYWYRVERFDEHLAQFHDTDE